MVPPRAFTSSELEQISLILGETMTGRQLNDLLTEARIEDRSGESTKWRRIRENLERRQRRDGHGAAIAHFIQLAMAPVRFTGRAQDLERFREDLNGPLALTGLTLGEDGRLARVTPARTLTEAERRARGLRAKLLERGVHEDVLRACRPELVAENYFHAVLEATKSLAEKIRARTGLTADGAELIDRALGLGDRKLPMLAFNRLETKTERSEHSGLHMLIRGVFAAFRNPPAHELKINWPVDEADALDLLQLVSLLHRRFDAAAITPSSP